MSYGGWGEAEINSYVKADAPALRRPDFNRKGNKPESSKSFEEYKRTESPGEWVVPQAAEATAAVPSKAGGSVVSQAGDRLDVNRMNKEDRDVYFANRRREKEIEELAKMGLSPDDFPSALSAVAKTRPAGFSSGGKPRGLPRFDEGRRSGRESNGREASWGQPSVTVTNEGSLGQQSVPSEPARKAWTMGYGEECVNGWGSSSSSGEVCNANGLGWSLNEPAGPSTAVLDSDASAGFAPKPVSPPATTAAAVTASVSGWSLDEPPKAAPVVPVVPAAFVGEFKNNQTDLAVSGWDIPQDAPIPQAAVAEPAAGPSWSIDKSSASMALPERRPLYSYEAEPPRPQQEQPAAPAYAPAPPAPSRPTANVNPLETVESWGDVEPIPTSAPFTAPVDPAPFVAPIVAPAPPPAASYRTEEVSMPPARPAPRANLNPLETVDSWGDVEPMPTAAPVAAPVHVPAPAVPAPAAVPAATIAPVAPAPNAPTPPMRSEPVNQGKPDSLYVDSWDCSDPIPTAAAPQQAAPSRPALPSVTCPHCSHTFPLP